MGFFSIILIFDFKIIQCYMYMYYSPYRNSVNIVFFFKNVFYDKILDQNFAHTYNKTPPNIQLHF